VIILKEIIIVSAGHSSHRLFMFICSQKALLGFSDYYGSVLTLILKTGGRNRLQRGAIMSYQLPSS